MTSSFAEDLLRQQYTFVPVPDALAHLHHAVHIVFARFCLLPEGIRRRYTLDLQRGICRVPSTKPDPDDGFLERKGQPRAQGGYHDHKMMWHFRGDLMGILSDRGLFELDEVKQLCHVSAATLSIYRDALYQVAESLDAHPSLSSLSLGELLVQDERLLVLRLIAYMQRRMDIEGDIVGQPHQDRSAGTFHGFQNEGALQTSSGNGWSTIQTPPGHLMYFTAMKLALATGGALNTEDVRVEGGDLPAFLHRGYSRAISLPTAKPRRVVVAFSHTDNTILF